MRIRFTLDSKYDPLKPLDKDVAYWGLEIAQVLCALWFLERAARMIRSSWAVAQMYYRHLLRYHNGRIWTLLNGMGTMGESRWELKMA